MPKNASPLRQVRNTTSTVTAQYRLVARCWDVTFSAVWCRTMITPRMTGSWSINAEESPTNLRHWFGMSRHWLVIGARRSPHELCRRGAPKLKSRIGTLAGHRAHQGLAGRRTPDFWLLCPIVPHTSVSLSRIVVCGSDHLPLDGPEIRHLPSTAAGGPSSRHGFWVAASSSHLSRSPQQPSELSLQPSDC